MKEICIIMATYNGGDFLAPQIESILKNTCQSFRLYIFDDGSTDRSFTTAKNYAARFPEKISAVQNPNNKGVIRNFLEAVATLEGDYYMFCDQDDVWLPEKIQKTLEFMEKQEHDSAPATPIAVFSDAAVVDAGLREIAPSFQRQSGYRTEALDLPHLLMENKLIGCTLMFNRALRDKLSHTDFPDAIRMHDWWIALIAASLGKIAYLDIPLLLYRQHETNIVGGSSKGSYLRNRIGHLRRDRKALLATMTQAQAFLSVYRKELPSEQIYLLHLFAHLEERNWLSRRYFLLRHGFLKSGLLRNLGVLLLI